MAEEQAREYINSVSEAFNPLWLDRTPEHALQRVWQRRDPLATLELVTLGKAIYKLRKHHAGWLSETIKEVRKEKDRGGHVTEILVCANLKPATGRLVPAPHKQPGFDARVQFADGIEHVVSVKRHDESAAERAFQRSCTVAYRELKRHFAERRLNRSIFCQFLSTAAPEDINRLVKETRVLGRSLGIFSLLNDQVLVTIREVYVAGASLSPHFASFDMVVVCPESGTEQTRFQSNLRSAGKSLLNAATHCGDALRVVYMRVHTSAKIQRLKEFADEALSGQNAGFDALVIHQPVAVINSAGARVINSVQFAGNSAFFAGVPAGRGYRFNAGFGEFTHKQVETALVDNQEAQIAKLDAVYVFQRGDHYVEAVSDGQGSLTGELSNVAPGVHRHSVVTLPGQAPFALGGIFPETETLSIV
jgi:hypothetical protein